MKYKAGLVFGLLILGACASTQPLSPKTSANWITLQTEPGPFCGRCDSTTIIIHHDGLVLIEQGKWLFNYRFWQTRRRSHQINADVVAKFRAHLQNFRPQGVLDLGDPENCDEYLYDVSGIQIRWNDDIGEDSLIAYFGCYSEARPAFAQDIKASVKLLGVDKLEIPEWGWKPGH